MDTVNRARNPVRPIPAADLTWLHMDRPNNLMHVRALMWFDDELDLAAVRAVYTERLLSRHPVFVQRPVSRDGRWYWEDAPDFDLADHLRSVRLGGDLGSDLGSDEETLKGWLGERFSEPLANDRPLWSVDLVRGVEGYGCLLLFRFHHALADGVRAVQLMFRLCDPVEAGDAEPARVGRRRRPQHPLALATDLVRRGVGDVADLALGVAKVPWQAARNLDPARVRRGVAVAAGVVRRPHRLVDLVQGLTSLENQSMNTVAEASRVLTAPRSPDVSWSGTPGVEKSVSWVTDLDLERVKAVGRQHGGSVNDALLALVSQALTRYLTEKDTPVDEIAWLVPVSLTPFDAELPEELGNHFALVFLPMPLGTGSTAAAVTAMHRRMTRIKHSVEPAINFGVQWVVAGSPRVVADPLTDLLANKGVGVLTNVPGPRTEMTFAGARLAGTLGWVPTSGDQPLGVAIFSYAGTVTIGIAADAALVPDPDRIAELLREEYLDW